MNEYLFDVKLFASVRVQADTEKEARRLLADALDAANINAGAWPNGDPVVFEASQGGEPDLMEVEAIDGSGEAFVSEPRA